MKGVLSSDAVGRLQDRRVFGNSGQVEADYC